MAMLAEKCRKKPRQIMPRGKPLYEDSNNIGTRLLEKMGWSKGKGLGVNEDGNKEYIRVKYKNDNDGFGYVDRDDQWTKHDKNFEDLLKSLHNSVENSDVEEQSTTAGLGFNNSKEEVIPKLLSGESLEEKSKNSKTRVHYKKFTRSKDISQYSEKDLANIFGKKNLNDQIKCNEIAECEDSTNFINNGTSVADYFKNKMVLLKNPNNNIEENGGEIVSEDISLSYSNSEENFHNPLKEDKDTTKKSKQKKKHRDIDSQNSSTEQDAGLEETEIPALNKRRKKKKEKKQELSDSQNTACNKLQEINQATEEKVETLKKTKKNKISQTAGETDPKNSIGSSVKSKKRKSDEKEMSEDVKPSGIKRRKDKENLTIEVAEDDCFIKNIDLSDKEIAQSLEALKTNATDLNMKKSKRSNQKEIRNEENNVIDTPSIDTTNLEEGTPQENKQKDNPNELIECAEKSKKKQKSKKKTEDLDIMEESKARDDEIQHPPNNSGCENTETNPVSDEYIYTISAFCGEKFRYTDVNGFLGSNIGDISGYGLPKKFSIQVAYNENDKEKISNMWYEAIDKYKQQMDAQAPPEKKRGTVNFKRFKKKKVFKVV